MAYQDIIEITDDTILYTAKVDKVFKTIMFNNKDILEAILKTVLKRPINIIDYIIQEIPVRKKGERRKTVDIIVKAEDEYLNIELNTSVSLATRLRNLNYFFSFVSQNTIEGDKYNTKTKFMQINLSFGMDEYYSEKTYKMFEKYKIQTDNQKVYYANLGIIEVNMDKVMKIWYDKNEKEIELNKYLIMLGLDTKGKLKEMGNGDEIVEKYTDKLSELNSSGVFVRAITPEEDARLVANTEKYLIEEEARNQGLSEGRAKGRAEGMATGKRQSKLEIAKEMLKDNVSISKIIKYTNLPISQIETLKKEML